MQVHSVRFTNPDQDEVEVGSDLGDFYLPWPCRSWHRQAILNWLEAGNKIRPHRRDDDPTTLRQGLNREVYTHAARLLDSVTAEYAIAEQIMWPDLEREARKFLLDGALGPLMKACLMDEGRSEEELAYAVVYKANRFNRFRGAVIAARDLHLRKIGQASIEILENYDTNSGWPHIPDA